jgi:hypothetical protein
VEWSEIGEDALEGTIIRVDIQNGGSETSRQITITGVEL